MPGRGSDAGGDGLAMDAVKYGIFSLVVPNI